MTYTDEQLKKIAEWLGIDLGFSKFGTHTIDMAFFIRDGGEYPTIFEPWLHSPDGQAAVMDRLENEFRMIFTTACHKQSHNAVFLEEYSTSSAPTKRFEGDEKETRQEALISAVLQMLEGK